MDASTWSALAASVGLAGGALRALRQREIRNEVLFGRPAVNGTPGTKGLPQRMDESEAWQSKHEEESHRGHRR